MLSRGTHVVVTDDSYRRTRQFLNQTLHRFGIEVSTVPAGDYEALEDAIRPDDARARQRVPDQSVQPHPRPRPLRRHRPAPSRQDGDRRDLRHALQPAPARVRRGHRHALGDEVPGRPQRPPRRRRARLAGPDRGDPRAAGGDGRRRRPVRRLPPRARAQDVRAAHGAPQRQRAGPRRVPRPAPAHRRRPLRGAAEPPAARHRPEADARLRRRGLLRGEGRPRRRLARGRRLPHPVHRGVARRARRASSSSPRS